MIGEIETKDTVALLAPVAAIGATAPLAQQPWLQDMLERTGNSLALAFVVAAFLTVIFQGEPASCITFLSEQAFAPQNTRFWSRRRVWFQFTVGEDKAPMLSVDNRGKGVLSMDCSAKRSPL